MKKILLYLSLLMFGCASNNNQAIIHDTVVNKPVVSSESLKSLAFAISVDFIKKHYPKETFQFPKQPYNVIDNKDSSFTVTAFYYSPVDDLHDSKNDYNCVLKYKGGNAAYYTNWDCRELFINGKAIEQKDL